MVSLNIILEHRAEIVKVAARHGASNVRVFGSVVKGLAAEGSDVDVLVHMDDERSLLDQISLMQDLEDLLGCKVDVVEDEALHTRLRDEVLAEAVAL